VSRRILLGILVLTTVVALTGCVLAETRFSGRRALKHVEKLCSFGPRPAGSEASRRAAEYITWVLEHEGWRVTPQEFAYGGQKLLNIVGAKGSGPLIILGTPYDTRPLADLDPSDRSGAVPGANDGASGVAVLLELARVLDRSATGRAEIHLVFFDAQDRGGVDGWPWSIGAQHLAGQVLASVQRRPEYVLILDMVGDHDQCFYYEWSSTLWLLEKTWAVAADLGYGAHFRPEYRHRILHDHSPFLDRGIPAALIMDLDYPYWRTRLDTVDKVSADSLQRIGDVLQTMLEKEPFGTRAEVGGSSR